LDRGILDKGKDSVRRSLPFHIFPP
jgi:hypothetical protein